MKKLILLLSVALLSANSYASDPFEPEVVFTLPSMLYVSGGFDSNDNVKIHIDGFFANGCYKTTKARVEVSDTAPVIMIQNRANYFNIPCVQSVSYYDKSIEIGNLKAGVYTLEFYDANEKLVQLGKLNVKQATKPEPDDFPYAPIAIVDVLAKNGKYYVELKGTYTNSCQMIDRVEFVKSAGNVIDVLPIMLDPQGQCLPMLKDFTYVAEITEQHQGKALLNVRSYEGNDKFLLHNFK